MEDGTTAEGAETTVEYRIEELIEKRVEELEGRIEELETALLKTGMCLPRGLNNRYSVSP